MGYRKPAFQILSREELLEKTGVLAEMLEDTPAPKLNGHAHTAKKYVFLERSEKSTVPAFPVYVFPAILQDIIAEYAEKRDYPKDLLAFAVLNAFSGAIGLNYKLKLRNGWESSALLFSALVGSSAIGKSPTMNLAFSPLIALEKRYQEAYKEEMSRYNEIEKMPAKDREKQNIELPEKPRAKEVIINDATIEALMYSHEENKKGLILLADELAGWLKKFNSYRKGADEKNWLSIWSNGMIKNNRISRGIEFIPESYISVVGGIQPSVLKELASGGLDNDGFLFRFLFAFAEEKQAKTWEEINQAIHVEAYNYYEKLILHYAEQPAQSTPTKLHLSEDAEEIWGQWFDQNQVEIYNHTRNNQDDLASIGSKMSQYCTRFALILQLIENAVLAVSNHQTSYLITADNMLHACQLTEYFKQTSTLALTAIEASNAENSSTSRVNWLAVFGEADELETGKIIEKIVNDYGYSGKTAGRYIKAELTKVRHGVWRI